jgi:hypothetical protein
MRSITKVGVGLLTAVAIGGGASSALADQIHVPFPPNQQACGGLVVAATNNQSGSQGPSGNPNASEGPGAAFATGQLGGQTVPQAIAGAGEFCIG